MKLNLVIMALSLSAFIPALGYGDNGSTSEADKAFLESLKEMYPLSPEQITEFNKKGAAVQEALEKMPVANIRSQSKPLYLEAGKLPAPILLTPFYVGAIAFFDTTGTPWNVTRVIVGNTEMFSLISANTEEANTVGDGHLIYVTPIRDHANSNLLVYLEGSQIPVSIPLISSPSTKDRRIHDGLTSFNVAGTSPHAQPPIFITPNKTISDTMIAVLDGIPGDLKEKQLSHNKTGIEVYESKDSYYVRSNLKLVFPAFRAYAENSGVFVYEITKTKTLVFLDNGQKVEVEVK